MAKFGLPSRGLLIAVASVSMLAACAIKQQVQAVSGLASDEICVIKSADVRAGFEEVLARSIRAQGYKVKSLPSGSSITECPATVTYRANWRWDLALYMAFAEIRVFKAGQDSGSAVYDSTAGGGNMNKFIDAEKKVAELTAALIPRR